MHRSSENVAAIATALAKAQTELSNPEKAMIGTIFNARTNSQQNFRYASLSSGLDIIRKVLGSQQIAIAQTTNIDPTSGTVNLTTVLLHTSGEWISSDWPVCQLSETSAPRRMGAALTYARRYALFTMVGIAGEDDLDAPDFANDGPKGSSPVGGDLAPGNRVILEVANARRPKPQAKGLLQEKLDAETSATARMQLIHDIQTLPADQLKPQAILKAKNRLTAEDAKLVEKAFEERMAPPDTTPKAAEGLAPTAEIMARTAPSASSEGKPVRRRPRERHLKNKTRTNEPRKTGREPGLDNVEAPNLSGAKDPGQPPVRHLNATSVIKIDKSMLYLSEIRRHRDKIHLRFVALQPCLICGRSPSDAHHLRFAQSRALGRKNSDEFAVPLCRMHHSQNHRVGDEVEWWRKSGIDPLQVANRLWSISRGVADGS